MNVSRRRLALVLALLLAAPGCTAWGRQPTPEPSSSRPIPSAVRVTRQDGSTTVLTGAAVSGDSIVGTGAEGERSAVAIADVRTLQARRTDLIRTVALTTVVALAVIIAAFAAAGPPPSY
ncbi:MAG TPA: hypothetical protein VFR81_00040 [Longimicrobium sp.]|nr:hypothetical protein [Longimicrobium sp.]